MKNVTISNKVYLNVLFYQQRIYFLQEHFLSADINNHIDTKNFEFFISMLFVNFLYLMRVKQDSKFSEPIFLPFCSVLSYEGMNKFKHRILFGSLNH